MWADIQVFVRFFLITFNEKSHKKAYAINTKKVHRIKQRMHIKLVTHNLKLTFENK